MAPLAEEAQDLQDLVVREVILVKPVNPVVSDGTPPARDSACLPGGHLDGQIMIKITHKGCVMVKLKKAGMALIDVGKICQQFIGDILRIECAEYMQRKPEGVAQIPEKGRIISKTARLRHIEGSPSLVFRKPPVFGISKTVRLSDFQGRFEGGS